MDYIYYLGKASLVIRVINYLQASSHDYPIDFMTVLHQLRGWVVRIKPKNWTLTQQANFHAYMSELGVSYTPKRRVNNVLHDLEFGDNPVEVMHRYQVAIVMHGVPDTHEIEVFRNQFIEGLGYCPETLA